MRGSHGAVTFSANVSANTPKHQCVRAEPGLCRRLFSAGPPDSDRQASVTSPWLRLLMLRREHVTAQVLWPFGASVHMETGSA